MKITVLGAFYPEFTFAANACTPFCIGLSRIPSVEQVTVVCQTGAKIPEGVLAPKLELTPSWSFDDPISLIRAARVLLRKSTRATQVVFNTYVTGFGKSRVTNAIGLTIPVLISLLFRRKVTMYMHNFVESQNVELLGYEPGLVDKLGAALIERLLLRFTKVFVPLETQARLIDSHLGSRPRTHFFPFLEASLVDPEDSLSRTLQPTSNSRNPTRVFLLGTWGPQKDLEGSLRSLSSLVREGKNIEITITGSINPHFSGFSLTAILKRFPELDSRTTDVGILSDEDLYFRIADSDILILPYKATGGYSSAINLAADTGVHIIAYDQLQIREQTEKMGIEVTFTTAENLSRTLRTSLAATSRRTPRTAEEVRRHRLATYSALSDFASRL